MSLYVQEVMIMDEFAFYDSRQDMSFDIDSMSYEVRIIKHSHF